jgi:maltose alpha-D-glucosyltransferase/alpha-amylase
VATGEGIAFVADAAGSTWYKDAVFYELHVRAFADSNGDGIGDFPGLLGKLDYLRDLGITTIWLLPFFPSPLLDDGYDIADYTGVHPAYGTLDDVRAVLDAAHRRDLRVVIELVLNHTSDQHPWFQRARRAPKGSPERDFYVWSDTPETYREARVIFRDYEQSNWTWDAVADAYFWHRFFSHQPDLNYANPAVREAIHEVVDFWLGMGVDGLRLDAVPYLAEREGTTSENLPGTHGILKELRARIDAKYQDRMLLAEANQWPEDAAAYFGDGDECQMAFHFPLMPRLFMALRTEDRLPVIDIMEQTPSIPDGCQWALFLRNHDELTLEMVTEEERLFMYRAYAPAAEARVNVGIRRRLAPLLGNSRRRIELMNALLCSLPGTPVMYYGDEIGMGDNIYLGDRDGVRTPMQWSADRNAGFSTAPPQRLYLPLITDYEYHHDTVHVEAQQQNSHSLLSFMKRLLALRKRSRAFGRGSLEFLDPTNHKILAFIRRHEEETILVVANLSRFGQAVDLDLSAYAGMTPVEAFGRIPFWPITEEPYRLTLGPHGFHWFRLSTAAGLVSGITDDAGQQTLSVITVDDGWAESITGLERPRLEQALPEVLGRQPWIRRSADTMLNARLLDAVPVPKASRPTWLVPVRFAYSDRDPEMYLLGLAFVSVEGDKTRAESQATPIARIRSVADGDAVLVDAVGEGLIDGALHWLADDPDIPLQGKVGQIVVERIQPDARLGLSPSGTTSGLPADEHGSNPVFQSEQVVVKFLRRLNEGINPEWEIGQALTEQGFPHAPTVLGALHYLRPDQPPMTVAVLQAHIPNNGHAWDHAVHLLDEFVHLATAQGIVVSQPADLTAHELLAEMGEPPPEALGDLLAPWLEFATLLGQRTADLHHALANITSRPAIVPEPYTSYDRRAIYQSMRGLTARTLRGLRQQAPRMEASERRLAITLVEQEQGFYRRLHGLLDVTSPGFRIRCHGDFHLGQVLRTGEDIVFVDFEGESDRFLEERRLKTSPLRDVASMLHSFQVAAFDTCTRDGADPNRAAEQRGATEALIRTWCRYGSAAYLAGYVEAAEADGFLPTTADDRATMIDALLLERAVYDLGYSLLHRPNELAHPLARVAQLLGVA